MISVNSVPFYLVERNDAVVALYKDAIEEAVQQDVKSFTLTFDAREVANMLTGKFEDMLSSLQHFRKSMPQLVYSVGFKFLRTPGSEEVIPEQEWKANPLYHRFFHKMFMETPYILFFTRDFDVRLYMIAGDYTKGNSPSVSKVETARGRKVKATGGATIYINKRLAEAGVTMLLYAHGSGFNPKETILSLLNEHQIAPEFAKIYKQYQRDVDKSFTVPAAQGQGGSAAA